MSNAIGSKMDAPEGSALSAPEDRARVKKTRGTWLPFFASLGLVGILAGIGVYEEGQQSRDADIE